MKNIKISVRLTILLSFCVICILALSVYFMSNMNKITGHFESFFDSCMPASVSASNIGKYLSGYRISEYSHVILDSKEGKKEASQEINSYYNLVQQEISNVEKYDMSSSEKEYINNFKTAWNNYIKQSQNAMNLSVEGKRNEAAQILMGASQQEYSSALDAIKKLIDSKEKTAQEAKEETHVIHSGVMSSSIPIVIIIIIIVCVANFIIIRSINLSIKNLKSAVKNISDGNMNVKLDLSGKDEISQLSKDFNKTVVRLNEYMNYIDEIVVVLNGIADGNLCYKLKYEYTGEFRKVKNAFESLSEILNGTMGNINESAVKVSEGSNQVSGNAQAFAQAAMEQADSVESLVSSIGKISNTISMNAESIADARNLANYFGKIINDSNKYMDDMMKSMEEITDTSGEISKIIKLIDDIAFQTNILSLNAAVEAARAGMAGKGFAVVADEVRNLATKSAEAAKNTAALIKNSIRAVENGTKIADDTAGILNSAVEETKKLIDTMNSISEVGEKQLEAVSSIRNNVDQISNVVQNNSAVVEESVSVSTELSEQAENLKNLVGRFNIKKRYTEDSYDNSMSYDVPEINLSPSESSYDVPVSSSDSGFDFGMSNTADFETTNNTGFDMGYDTNVNTGFNMNYDTDGDIEFDTAYGTGNEIKLDMDYGTDTEIELNSNEDIYDDGPGEIILTENAADAYVPKTNIVKTYNDNGSDKY